LKTRLRLCRVRGLVFAIPKITIAKDKGVLTLVSPTFAWGVALDLDGERPVPDNCFDLIPGIPYDVEWPKTLGEPKVLMTGNALVRCPVRKKGK